MTKQVAIFLADGFEEIEAITPIDVLRRVNLVVDVISISNHLEVIGAHHIQVKADKTFQSFQPNQYDLMVLPGGMPGSDHLFAHEGLKKTLVEHHAKGKPLAAICAAPYILGELGLLKNKKATCFPGYENQLHGAMVTKQKVENDGNIVTGNGAGNSMLFALELVSLLCGPKTAEELATRMMVK